MIYGGGLLGLVVLALWVYCIVDVVSTDDSLVRNLPKLVWLLLVIFVPTIGSITWLLLGRPQNASFVPGDSRPRPPTGAGRRFVPPDDSPDFLSSLDERSRDLRRWEEDLKRREDDLRRKKDQGE
ncbi:MAG: PLD nuclease N-terminal domain-containing protein [Actinomycetota bacterium]